MTTPVRRANRPFYSARVPAAARRAILAFVGSLLAGTAQAQRPVCVTSTGLCPAQGQQPNESCRCPGSLSQWGTVVIYGRHDSYQADRQVRPDSHIETYYERRNGYAADRFGNPVPPLQEYGPVLDGQASPQVPPLRRQPFLRNDDLDDSDDVLAGPRHHRRRRSVDDDR